MEVDLIALTCAFCLDLSTWTSLLNDLRRGLFSRRVTLGLLGGGLRLPLSCRVERQRAEPSETRRKRDDERRTIVRRRTFDELVERC